MAIFKIINTSAAGHAALKGVLRYVLQDKKTEQNLISGIGDFEVDDQAMDADSIYLDFCRIKKLYRKDSGRQYMHAVQSFPPGESTPEQVHMLGVRLAEKIWPEQQVLIVTHIDRDHLHNHFVINTVSYLDGQKLHWKKQDLENAKQLCNTLCQRAKLSVPMKGMHYNGTRIDIDVKAAWDKNLYQIIQKAQNGEIKSYVADCAKAIVKATKMACSKEEFAADMLGSGWTTIWDEHHKYVTYVNKDGQRIRNCRMGKITGLDLSKDGLLHIFDANTRERNIQQMAIDAANQWENNVSATCLKLAAEEELNGYQAQYTRNDVRKIQCLMSRLYELDKKIAGCHDKILQLIKQKESISGYHPLRVNRINKIIRIEKSEMDAIQSDIDQIIRRNGYSDSAKVKAEYINCLDEMDKIEKLKSNLSEAIKSEQEASMQYQEQLAMIQEPDASAFQKKFTALLQDRTNDFNLSLKKKIGGMTEKQILQIESGISKSNNIAMNIAMQVDKKLRM